MINTSSDGGFLEVPLEIDQAMCTYMSYTAANVSRFQNAQYDK